MVAHIFKMAGHHVGVATSDGVYIDGHLTVEGDMTGPGRGAHGAARPVGRYQRCMETARGGMLKRGMGYQRANVGAVLNVQADHLGLRGIDTLEDLAKVKRILVEVAQDTAVLNADDPLCLRMADYTKAELPVLRDDEPQAPAGARAHPRRRPGDGARGGHQRPHDHDLRPRLAHPAGVDAPDPGDARGRAMHNVQNAMFAAAVAYSDGGESGGDPARIAHLRHHFLSGPRAG